MQLASMDGWIETASPTARHFAQKKALDQGGHCSMLFILMNSLIEFAAFFLLPQ